MRKVIFYNLRRNGASLGTVKAQLVVREVGMVGPVQAASVIKTAWNER